MEEAKYLKWAKTALVIIGILTVFFGYMLSKIEFSYDFESFFPEEDPATEFYFEFRETFGSDADFVLLALENEEGIFQEDFLRKAQALQSELERMPHVESVQSIFSMNEMLRDPFLGVIFERPYVRLDEPEKMASDSTRIYSSPELVNTFVSSDGKSLAFMMQHTVALSKEKCDELSGTLREHMAASAFEDYKMAGRSVGQGYFVERLEYELFLFVSVSCIFIVLFLIIAFRSVWGVIVPLVVVFLSIIWLIGMMKVTDKPIDPLLSIVPTILFVVGMSDVVHIISKYFDELRKKKPKLLALKTAMREVGIATFLTSLTTSVGFLTLMGSNIMPIREFGLYSALGVFIAYFLAFTLLPATLLMSKVPKMATDNRKESFWTVRLHRLYLWVISHRKGILYGSIVLFGICFWGISKVQVNNELLEDLREDNPMKQEYRYFEKKYAGARPFEMSIQVTDSSKTIFDWEVMQAMDKVDAFIREEYQAGALVSPLNFVKMLNRADHSGRAAYYSLPQSKGKLKKLSRDMSRFKKNEAFSQFVSEDLSRMRLTGKVGDWGAIRIREKDKLLAEFWKENVPEGLMSYELTGMAVLIDKNNSYLSTTMVTGLLIAFLIVALIVGIMYRDVKMVIISLIPNVLPLLMIAAIMGFTGIYLKVSTSIIFTIAFGIAVDDTIHFMSKLRLELGKGRTMQYALKRTFIGTGKAIIITSLILSSGFMTLTLSTFKGTFYTGSLLSLTLLFAVVADLLLIPVLVWLFYGKEKVRPEGRT